MKYEYVKEENMIIDLSDGKKIHGYLRGPLQNEKGLVVMMHGLPGNPHETLQYLGSRFLHEQGYTTFSLAMYDFGNHYRSVFDCTLDTHIQDFEEVVAWLKTHQVEKIFAVGHSYGGITVLGSSVKLDGAVLWDPSHGLAYGTPPSDVYPEFTLEDYRIGRAGSGYIFPEAIAQYNESLGDNSSWAAGKGYPIKFITAGNGILCEHVKKYYDQADEPKNYVKIEDASHQFTDNDEVVSRLFAETADWFKSITDE